MSLVAALHSLRDLRALDVKFLSNILTKYLFVAKRKMHQDQESANLKDKKRLPQWRQPEYSF